MIDYNKLEHNKKEQVTLRSLMDFLLYCNSEERWDAFYEIANGELASEYPMSWKTFYKGLQFAYGSGKAAPSEASELFEECQFDWYECSTKKEQRFYDAIEGEDYLYRGCTEEEGDEYGISWTTDKGVAEFFAYRFKDILEKNGKHPRVIKIKVKDLSGDICGVLLDRGEKEVIIPNGFVEEENVEVDSTEPTEAYEKYMKKREKVFDIND